MPYTVTPEVPYFSQYSNKECWYIAYKMLFAHRFGLAAACKDIPVEIESMHERSATNSGIGLDVDEFGRFAEAAGLVPTVANTTKETTIVNTMPVDRTIGNYSTFQLEVLLRNHGPLWVSYKIHKGGHIIVVVGVDGQNVYYHDPQAGGYRSTTIQQFNRNLNPKSENWQIMYLPKTARPGPADIGTPLPQKASLSLKERFGGVALP